MLCGHCGCARARVAGERHSLRENLGALRTSSNGGIIELKKKKRREEEVEEEKQTVSSFCGEKEVASSFADEVRLSLLLLLTGSSFLTRGVCEKLFKD